MPNSAHSWAHPFRTASLAICDALHALGIGRIHLMSPYPDWLTGQTVAYGAQAGIDVLAVEQLLGEGEQFRAYETRSDEVVGHLQRFVPQPNSAVLLSGTG
ncbi:MAG: hypothetical protein KDB56_07370 [Mycobacterium sp.]|nr:hypothetical protein [Mycobacterium sp.]